jgi:hypothetical protein
LHRDGGVREVEAGLPLPLEVILKKFLFVLKIFFEEINVGFWK